MASGLLDPSSPYYAQAVASANKYGVPVNVELGLLQAESAGNPNAYNTSSGATGIAQFLPSTAANPGYGIAPFDPTDPNASIDASAQYLAAMRDKTGSWTSGLQAYNAGAGSSLVGSSSFNPYSYNPALTQAAAAADQPNSSLVPVYNSDGQWIGYEGTPVGSTGLTQTGSAAASSDPVGSAGSYDALGAMGGLDAGNSGYSVNPDGTMQTGSQQAAATAGMPGFSGLASALNPLQGAAIGDWLVRIGFVLLGIVVIGGGILLFLKSDAPKMVPVPV